MMPMIINKVSDEPLYELFRDAPRNVDFEGRTQSSVFRHATPVIYIGKEVWELERGKGLRHFSVNLSVSVVLEAPIATEAQCGKPQPNAISLSRLCRCLCGKPLAFRQSI